MPPTTTTTTGAARTGRASGSTIDANGVTLTIAGNITDGNGSGKLTVLDSSFGSGTVVLQGTNTYSGGTTIDAGATFSVGYNASIGSLYWRAWPDEPELSSDSPFPDTGLMSVSAGAGGGYDLAASTWWFDGSTLVGDGVTVAKEIELEDKWENVGAEFIKTGSLSRSERLEKYNRLMDIEIETSK